MFRADFFFVVSVDFLASHFSGTERVEELSESIMEKGLLVPIKHHSPKVFSGEFKNLFQKIF